MKNVLPLSLVRIHNNEPSQGSVESAELISRIASSQSFSVQTVEVSEQPTLLTLPQFNHPRRELVGRRNRQRKLELSWYIYLGSKFLLIKRIKSLIGQSIFVVAVIVDRNKLAQELRIMQIERFVTAKHVKGLRDSAKLGAAISFVLEVDAIAHENSIWQIEEIFDLLSTNSDHSVYFNVAGGLDQEDIGISGLARRHSSSVDSFETAVSNTSCAYAINEIFLNDFLKFIDSNPNVLNFGIDWVFNSFFLNLDNKVVCFHSSPPALSHGSFTGKSESWNPRNRS